MPQSGSAHAAWLRQAKFSTLTDATNVHCSAHGLFAVYAQNTAKLGVVGRMPAVPLAKAISE